MHLGLNVDPLNWDNPTELAHRLKDANCAFIVFPWNNKLSADYPPYGVALDLVGIEPIPVLARESLADADAQNEKFAKAIQRIMTSFPKIEHVVLGNEQDAKLLPIASERSWDMTPAAFMDLLKARQDHLPAKVKRVTGGTVSGQPNWWKQITNLHGAARHAHLYAQTHDTVKGLLKAHRDAGVPITFSLEFGWPVSAFNSEHERAVELSNFLVALREEGIEYAAPFRYSDRGDAAEQFGLADENGNARESLAAFSGAAVALA